MAGMSNTMVWLALFAFVVIGGLAPDDLSKGIDISWGRLGAVLLQGILAIAVLALALHMLARLIVARGGGDGRGGTPSATRTSRGTET